MRMIILGLILILFYGCSSGSSGSSSITGPSSSNKPAISNLTYSPKSATLNQGGGAITINIYIDYVDLDRDISTFTMTTSSGSSKTISVSASTIGTLAISVITTTTTSGNYTFDVYVTDSKDNISNTLTGTFAIS